MFCRRFLFGLVVATTLALIGPAPCHAGFLVKGDNEGIVTLKVPGQFAWTQQLYGTGPFDLPIIPQFQLDLDGTFATDSSGRFDVLAGLGGHVSPQLAYLSIPNGTHIHITPPALDSPGVFPENTWTSSLSFVSSQDVGYVGVPGVFTEVFHAMKYSVHGYLAPGATVHLSATSTIWTGTTAQYAPRLSFGYTYTSLTGGEFEFEYEKIVEFADSEGFNSAFNPVFGTSWQHEHTATFSITTPTGVGSSWAVLDPGASTGLDDADLFPWVAPSDAVPEPSSLVMFGLGSLVMIVCSRFSRP